ncbi:hypothetical protein SAY86_023778 [Trapa natans]|uniref:GBF-interacting protein 1 N-terminal domain-containing protein n=1 Tax=Trapa natans TaxID=22666 RepID=A0AAN7M8I7_TRANT|nr:hypothetical protein SAY86_023778 [Trapa natans]
MMVSYTYSAEEKGMIEILKGAMPFRSEHEIYKALKECSKEALQNLLFQDTFEEVKEKPEKQIEKREMETTKSVMDRGLSYEGCKFYQEDRYDSSGSSEYHTVLSKDENAISISSEENPSSPYESTGSTFTQSSSDSDSPIINDSEQTNVEGNTANSSSLSETTYQPLDLIADIVKVLSEIEEEGSLHIDSLNLPKTSEQIIGEDITSTSSSQPLTTSNPSDLIADIEKILVTNMEEEGSLYNDPLKLIETSKSYDAASYVPSVSHFGEPPLGQTREDDEKFILPSHLKAPTVGCPPLNFGTYNSKSPSTTIGIRAPTSLKMDSGNLSTPNNYLSTQPLIETSENCDGMDIISFPSLI